MGGVLSWVILGTNAIASVLIKERQRGLDTDRRGAGAVTRDPSDPSTKQGAQAVPGAARGQEQILLKSQREGGPADTSNLVFWLPDCAHRVRLF